MQKLPIYEMGKRLKSNPSKNLAWKIIKEFYDFYDRKEVENNLWFVVSGTIGGSSEDLDITERGNVLHFYEFIKVVNDALFYLHESTLTE